MEDATKIARWLMSLPEGALVGVDEGGLCLRAVHDGELTGDAYDIGGVPIEIEHPEEREWNVQWTKSYVASGTERVTARTEEEAQDKVLDRIGDLEGSTQYDPDRNTAEAYLVDNPNEENGKTE